MTPAKPFCTSTSALPSRFAAGTRQSLKLIEAVSEALIPSFFSRRVTVIPGVPFSTTRT